MPRRLLALRAPDENNFGFARFPQRTVRSGSRWYRQHRDRPVADRGAWFFSSHPAGAVGGGRFDLPTPDGTCYLASTPAGAIHELIGPDHARRGWVDADLIAGRVLSRLTLPHDVRAADFTSATAANFRLTNEIVSTDRYDLSQAWAAAMRRSGFDGVHVALRFTPGGTRGLALFGDGGRPDPVWPGDRRPRSVRKLVESMGIEVVDPPAVAAVTVVSP